MWDAPTLQALGPGRVHLRHGPIDVVVTSDGSNADVIEALSAIFPTLLPELCMELPALRRPVQAGRLRGHVAWRMEVAALAFDAKFVTPMAAVAGAVADRIAEGLRAAHGVTQATVNNGGDIALICARPMRIGICDDLQTGHIGSVVTIVPEHEIGGIATSGWQGRSHSLGVADAVTVLARTAALADVAATLIANATNINIPGIDRVAASTLSPNSDLGERLVTVDVPRLATPDRDAALDAGLTLAQTYLERDLIAGCYLCVQGETRVLHPLKEFEDA